MAIEFESRGPQIGRADIDAFQSAVGARPPDDYGDFLAAQNGGRPEANELPGNPQVGVDEFFSLGVESGDGLVQMLSAFRDRVPACFLPIAHSAGGNLLCISLRENDKGRVYFWDHECEADEGEPRRDDNITAVASSFAELLDGLAPAGPAPDSANVTDGWIDPELLEEYGRTRRRR